MMIVEQANIKDSEVLTTITKKSKAYWGYTDAQIALWNELLTINEAYIEANYVYKLVLGNVIAGYYSYFNTGNNIIQLDNLFVLPGYIGKGHGKFLMDDFLLRVTNTPAEKIILEADPNAEGFYTKFGFIKTGQLETSIENRFIPVMELTINKKNSLIA